MAAIAHLAWPYRAGVTVDQDSAAERKAAAAVLACTPRGALWTLPTFGVTTPLFQQRPLDTGLLAAQINEFDPRLDVTASEALDLAQPTVADVTVAVTAAQED